MTAFRWAELSREDVSALAAESVLVLPLGATEQHGPHLPTCTDALVVGALAWEAAQRVMGLTVIVAPTLTYGASHHHLPFGGTLSLTNESLLAVLRDLLASAATDGFTRVFLLNGHGGNAAIARVAATEEARRLGISIGFASYWDLAPAAEADGPTPGHAGWFETSLVLALAPELVRLDRAGPPPREAGAIFSGPPWIERPESWLEIGGFTDDPREASPEAGRTLVARFSVAVAAAIGQLADLE